MLETPAWYLINCFPGDETEVRQGIERVVQEQGMQEEILQIIAPTPGHDAADSEAVGPIQALLYPGILLIHMLLTEKTYALLHQVPGVVGLAVQTPLRFEALFLMLPQMKSRRTAIIEAFAVGKPGMGQIVDGPFNGFEARLDKIDLQRSQVIVRVRLMERDTPVALGFHQFELRK